MFNSNIIDLALAEDLSHGDVTSEVLIPAELQGKASMLSWSEIAKEVFLKVDPSAEN